MKFPGKQSAAPPALKCQGGRRASANNKGFTMVESLLVLMIFISIAALFPLVYGALYRTEEQLDPERRAEWELFILQLRKEMHLSHSLQITEERIIFVQGADLVSIEKYQEGVRRRVGGRGHEIILQEVVSIRFYSCGSLLCAEAAFENGEKEEAQLHLYRGETI
ncbi:competence type IV pilus minor pilin ComGF [Pseudobacillus badius]|uniref:competence type IV pilus minor pilin ComGF n=1 Tax=Bacillus badius TaxID=1455 RepID=UPI0024A1DD3F|nr:competence type IV pilus minor pilin ComGF [Bacillus badius]GLY09945.1 hypothetical protein Bbad01_11610 [Bacillus badius]